MNRFLCIHGHFYQPPRENPWLEEVELQETARPFHDWNERITAECYAPNTASRILDHENRIIDIVNNYSKISFNFGPTLLSWMARHQPHIHEAILEADRISLTRYGGHGSGLAQVYNHMIMPLATRRDKYTQVLWGLEDFRSRFGRDPEGMWLPETAVDLESLDILAELGIRFTILSPRQASKVRKKESKEWNDVSGERVDPKIPYHCTLPSGRSITLFFYDGPISRDLAFGGMLSSGENFRNRLKSAYSEVSDQHQLVHIATDGETYGHHFRHGEMALSYCLYLVENDPQVQLVNYGQFLEQYPPQAEVRIFENSSWSCIHGVERWRTDCGCNSGMHPGWHQDWREPLRDGLDWLGEQAAQVYAEQAKAFFAAPWKARDEYIRIILNRDQENVTRFLAKHAQDGKAVSNETTALKLLEMQRFAQLIFTSCGWFFDEISGIETVQVLQYAAKTIQLIEDLTGQYLEEKFMAKLEKAPSNVKRSGADVFRDFVKPAQVDMSRVAAHYAISSLFEEYPEELSFGCYRALSQNYQSTRAGRSSLALGKVKLQSVITRESADYEFAALHLGDHNVSCGIRVHQVQDGFREMRSEISAAFERGDVTESIRIMDKHFLATYSIFHLFRDEQRKVVDQILEQSYESAESAFRSVLQTNYTVLNFLHWLGITPPSQLTHAAEHVIKSDMKSLFRNDSMDLEQLELLIGDARKWSLDLRDESLVYIIAGWINAHMQRFAEHLHDLGDMEIIVAVLELLEELPAELNLWETQNIYFLLSEEHLESMRQRASLGETHARKWVHTFQSLGELLKIQID